MFESVKIEGISKQTNEITKNKNQNMHQEELDQRISFTPLTLTTIIHNIRKFDRSS